jgi:hypothetical protein
LCSPLVPLHAFCPVQILAHEFYSCYDWEKLGKRQISPPPFKNGVNVIENGKGGRDETLEQVAEAAVDFDSFKYMDLEVADGESEGGDGRSPNAELKVASPVLAKVAIELEPPKRVSSRMMIQQMSQRASHMQKKILKRKDSLIEQSMQLNLVMDLLPMMVHAKDSKGNILLSNKEMAAAYGCTRAQLEGQVLAPPPAHPHPHALTLTRLRLHTLNLEPSPPSPECYASRRG